MGGWNSAVMRYETRKPLAETRLTENPAIDVVVPAYNAGGYIDRCLDGLLSAGFARSEVTVVDDGSTDDTAARCRARGIEPLRLDRNRSASTARNAGARQGRSAVVFFVDADVVVGERARAVLEEFFRRHPGHAAVFGTYDDSPADPGRVSRIRNLLHRHVHISNEGEAITFWSGCGAVRRSAFEAVGGFDETVAMMEDVDLGLRLTLRGARIRLLAALEGKHLKRWTLSEVARTDLVDRAIPWARLLARPEVRDLPDALNVNATSRASVASVAASLAALAALPFAPAPAAAVLAVALATLVLANGGFLVSLLRGGGAVDALAAVPVLWIHYLCGGLGFAWVRLTGPAGPA